jgi:hypothetical protein
MAIVGAIPATAIAMASQVPAPLNKMAEGSTGARPFMLGKLARARDSVEMRAVPHPRSRPCRPATQSPLIRNTSIVL